MKEILAIDFDGTTCLHQYPNIGPLMPYAKEVINKLAEKYYIIIWTCRDGKELEDARKYLDLKGIYYDKINENAPMKMYGFQPKPKIFYHTLVDDRNLQGFPGWLETYKILEGEDFIINE